MDAMLAALDLELRSRGFTRRARAHEWTKQESNDTAYVHLNVGKAVLNPSVGVIYRDLASLLPARFGAFGTHATLASLVPTHPQYDRDTSALVLVSDVVSYGLPMVARLRDRRFVVRQLQSESPQDWLTSAYSTRIRLLPLLLLSLDQRDEARTWLSKFEIESLGRDQLVPPYREFVLAVREGGGV